MNNLKANLENVNRRIAAACLEAGRNPGEVAILAVSKRHPAIKIRRLYAAGQRAFGENYAQEATKKQLELNDLPLEWHFIGPVQSNKTADIAAHFHWVQSVDREKILQRLSMHRPANLPDLNICLQVNIDHEAQKSGALPEAIPALARLATELPRLKLRGLMAIPRAPSGDSVASTGFEKLKDLFNRLRADGHPLDTLSMGMSADIEHAVWAGSTMVRIGTDLFGARE